MAGHESEAARQHRLVASMKELRAQSPNLAQIVRLLPDVRSGLRRSLARMTPESVQAVGFTEEELDAIGPMTDEDRERILSEPAVLDDEATLASRHGAAQKEIAISVRNLVHSWRSAGRPPSKRVLAQLRQSLQECEKFGVVPPVELTPVEKRMLGVRDG